MLSIVGLRVGGLQLLEQRGAQRLGVDQPAVIARVLPADVLAGVGTRADRRVAQP